MKVKVTKGELKESAIYDDDVKVKVNKTEGRTLDDAIDIESDDNSAINEDEAVDLEETCDSEDDNELSGANELFKVKRNIFLDSDDDDSSESSVDSINSDSESVRDDSKLDTNLSTYNEAVEKFMLDNNLVAIEHESSGKKIERFDIITAITLLLQFQGINTPASSLESIVKLVKKSTKLELKRDENSEKTYYYTIMSEYLSKRKEAMKQDMPTLLDDNFFIDVCRCLSEILSITICVLMPEEDGPGVTLVSLEGFKSETPNKIVRSLKKRSLFGRMHVKDLILCPVFDDSSEPGRCVTHVKALHGSSEEESNDSDSSKSDSESDSENETDVGDAKLQARPPALASKFTSNPSDSPNESTPMNVDVPNNANLLDELARVKAELEKLKSNAVAPIGQLVEASNSATPQQNTSQKIANGFASKPLMKDEKKTESESSKGKFVTNPYKTGKVVQRAGSIKSGIESSEENSGWPADIEKLVQESPKRVRISMKKSPVVVAVSHPIRDKKTGYFCYILLFRESGQYSWHFRADPISECASTWMQFNGNGKDSISGVYTSFRDTFFRAISHGPNTLARRKPRNDSNMSVAYPQTKLMTVLMVNPNGLGLDLELSKFEDSMKRMMSDGTVMAAFHIEHLKHEVPNLLNGFMAGHYRNVPMKGKAYESTDELRNDLKKHFEETYSKGFAKVEKFFSLDKFFSDFDIKQHLISLGYNSFEEIDESQRKHVFRSEVFPDWDKIEEEPISG